MYVVDFIYIFKIIFLYLIVFNCICSLLMFKIYGKFVSEFGMNNNNRKKRLYMYNDFVVKLFIF